MIKLDLYDKDEMGLNLGVDWQLSAFKVEAVGYTGNRFALYAYVRTECKGGSAIQTRRRVGAIEGPQKLVVAIVDAANAHFKQERDNARKNRSNLG